jgi:hypothetical protein
MTPRTNAPPRLNLVDWPGGLSHYAEYTDTVVTVRKPIRSYNR